MELTMVDTFFEALVTFGAFCGLFVVVVFTGLWVRFAWIRLTLTRRLVKDYSVPVPEARAAVQQIPGELLWDETRDNLVHRAYLYWREAYAP
jgi:hypothetical protein